MVHDVGKGTDLFPRHGNELEVDYLCAEIPGAKDGDDLSVSRVGAL